MSATKSLLLGFLIAGCATSGPVPEPTMAVIGSKETFVDSIDDRNVRDDHAGPGARFEIPAGHHTITVGLYTGASPGPDEASKVIAVCFGALAGHSYLAQPVYESGRWHPEIVDEATGAAVQSACPSGPDPLAPQSVAEAAPSPPSAAETPAVPPIAAETS